MPILPFPMGEPAPWYRQLIASASRAAAELSPAELEQLLALGGRISAGDFEDDRANVLALRLTRWKQWHEQAHQYSDEV